jgi:ABC-type dipeptide/oligopeptide/nickel transport system ATPase component
MKNQPLLTICNLNLFLSKCKSEIHALKNINFSVGQGEIVGLVGESGSGKSLTVQTIMGLLAKNIHRTSGEIIFENQNLLIQSEKNLRQIRGKKIGFVAQDPSSALNPTLKIGKQLVESLGKHQPDLSKKQVIGEGMKWLERMSISNPEQRFNQYPHELSGGMKQRIAIAMALICKPSLLLADEPTTALDVTVQAEILTILKELCQENRIGILLITHDLGVVANCCDHVLVLHKGQIVESGQVDAIFMHPKQAYTQALLHSKQSLLLDKALI